MFGRRRPLKKDEELIDPTPAPAVEDAPETRPYKRGKRAEAGDKVIEWSPSLKAQSTVPPSSRPKGSNRRKVTQKVAPIGTTFIEWSPTAMAGSSDPSSNRAHRTLRALALSALHRNGRNHRNGRFHLILNHPSYTFHYSTTQWQNRTLMKRFELTRPAMLLSVLRSLISPVQPEISMLTKKSCEIASTAFPPSLSTEDIIRRLSHVSLRCRHIVVRLPSLCRSCNTKLQSRAHNLHITIYLPI
jgi:hypothetical protein